MTKVRSREECLYAIQSDIAWRKKEISALKSRLYSEDPPNSAYLRSALVMVYAHWEGFVKTACEAYVLFINECIARRNVSLSEHFKNLQMWKTYRTYGEHQFLKNPVPFLEMREKWPPEDLVMLPIDVLDTESNLNSRVLKRLISIVDIDYQSFETKEKLIDESLLGTRNKIAHGERIEIDIKDYESLETEIRNLLDAFQTLIEECVQHEKYRAN